MRKTYKTDYDLATDGRHPWPSVEEVAKLLWETPTTRIAAIIGVSDTAVKKFARKHGLTKPARGYWAKKYALDLKAEKAAEAMVKEMNALEAQLEAHVPAKDEDASSNLAKSIEI